MYKTRSVTEVARHFADYINRVVYRGERFVLMRGNKPVAESLDPCLWGDVWRSCRPCSVPCRNCQKLRRRSVLAWRIGRLVSKSKVECCGSG